MFLNSHNPKLKHLWSRKLLPPWARPFIAKCHITLIAYHLELPDSLQTINPVFHISNLIRYRTDDGCQPPPPLTELEGELKYEVKEILDESIREIGRHNRIEYLIHWRGYDHVHDSWEPIPNLQHCQESI